MSMKNILILSAPHPKKKAGIVAVDLYNIFIANNWNPIILTEFYKKSQNDNLLINSFHSKYSKIFYTIKNRILRKFKQSHISNKFYFDGTDRSKPNYSTYSIIKSIGEFKPDVILILFTQNFIHTQNIKELYEYYKTPIYWYLMDMQPFTGGCAYSWDCDGYTKSCGNCPAIGSINPKDVSYYNLLSSIKNIQNIDLNILVGSEQLLIEVRNSMLLNSIKTQKILLGIDEQLFKPLPKSKFNFLKKSYNIDSDCRVFFLGAVNLNEERKGLHILINALKIIKKTNHSYLEKIVFIIATNQENELIKEILEISSNRVKVINVGFKEKVDELVEIFGISDFFISTSIVDSGPMMINQSIMCGTPVIAFKIGVAMDLVKTNISGILVEDINPESLSRAIISTINLTNTSLINMKAQTRMLGLTSTSYNYFFNKLQDIFNE